MDGNYIKLFRSMLDWEWYSDINTKVLFLHMLLKANWRDKEWQGIVIERGQFVSSYSKLSYETGLTVAQIRTSLKRLISTGEITHNPQAKYGLFTVINYDRFQSDNSQYCSQITVTQQASDSQITTTKNKKKDKKYNCSVEQRKEIIEYLNQKSGKRYKYENEATARHINARFDDGYNVEDFKRVIDVKVSEWKDTDMEKYLRPDTLFRPGNFENYLNQAGNYYQENSDEYRLVNCFEVFRTTLDDKYKIGNKNNACEYFNRLICKGREAKEIYAIMDRLFKCNNSFLLKKYKTVKEFCEKFEDLYVDLRIEFERGDTKNGRL